MHKPIQFKNICFSLPHKRCFDQFNETISYGQRIAIIGQNGSGKSTLLRILQGLIEPTDGELLLPNDLSVGYVPQLIDELETLSGGQRFNEKLTVALVGLPNILLLDEPTNHLDRKNRQSLMRMLRSFEGTLIVVTHDVELLSQVVDTIWHIDQGRICVFTGSYEDYRREQAIQYQSIEQKLSELSRQKKDAHRSLMKEQARAKNSRQGGEKKIENRKWPTVGSAVKMGRANETSNRKKSEISHKKQVLVEQISALRLPEIVKPTFSIQAGESGRVLVSISDGSVGFESPLLTAINLSVTTGERIAISGDNGSGKSTLIRAILGDTAIAKTGSWQVLKREGIGYLDQHYSTLDVQKTVLDIMQDYVSNMTTILTLRLGQLTESNLVKRLAAIWPFYKPEVVLNELKWFVMNIIVTVLQAIILLGFILIQLKEVNAILIGTVVMIFRYQWDLSDVFYTFSAHYSELVQRNTNVQSIQPIVDDIQQYAHTIPGKHVAEHWKTMTIDDLHYQHPGTHEKNAIRDVTLNITRGEKIALIGASGAGKSTLLNLLSGLYTPDTATLCIDGNCFQSLEPLHAITTLIPQEPEIFENTIAFNITMDLEATPEDLQKVMLMGLQKSY